MKQEGKKRHQKVSVSAERLDCSEDVSRKSEPACVVTAVALCVCVCVSSLLFSPCGKKRAAIVKIGLSVCRVSDKVCSACMCSVGHTRSLPDRRWSLERGDLKSAAEASFA